MNNATRFYAANLSAALVLLLGYQPIGFAQFDAPQSPRQNIRFYKVNKDLQAGKIRLTDKKVSTQGCHNFIKRVRVHRAVQIGYGYCSLYTEKDCKPASVVSVDQEEDARRTSLLAEGMSWLPVPEDEIYPSLTSNKKPKKESQGVKLASWRCGNDLNKAQLAHEARLSANEVLRLDAVATKASQLAALYQQRANKARKQVNKATEKAALVKKKAVAAGVTFPKPKKSSGKGRKKDGNPIKEKPDAESEE